MNAVILVALLVAALDQLTKWLVVRSLAGHEVIAVIPGFFQLVHWRNTGAAWGMLAGQTWLLTVISIAALAALYWYRRALLLERAAVRVAIGLITGGIIGNLVDRLWHGSVIDFLDFQLRGHHWPAFNVADSGICIGVGLYILVTWRRPQPVQNS